MASFVNAADAAAAAVEIERRGYAFYKNAEEKAKHGSDKEFFAFLAGEEKRHEGIFGALLERLGGVALPAGSTDEEYLKYVQGLIDSHFLFMPDQQRRMLESPLQAAMQLEKDTLLFFLELETLVPDSEKKFVRECADEERRHLRLILQRFGG